MQSLIRKDQTLTSQDSLFINRLKGIAMLLVVLGHLGLGWIWSPYSNYINLVVPLFFFCSGYIFFYLFHKRNGNSRFFITRVLGAIVPFYCVYVLAVLLTIFVSSNHSILNIHHLYRALVIAPHRDEMPYPLYQIWFLRVLLFSIVSSTLLMLFNKEKNAIGIYLIAILIGTTLTGVNSFQPIYKYFQFYGHDFYQEIVYSIYFYIGLIMATVNWRRRIKALLILAVCFIACAGLYNYYTNGSINLTDHAYAPDIFYIFMGVGFIFIVLSLADVTTLVLNKIKYVDFLIQYSGNHSYSIFLIHTFFILFSETYWGWIGVKNNPQLALLKISFVLAASLITAYPITTMTKYILKKITAR